MARDQHLPPKLEAMLARLCEQLGPLTKTKAVKLPYLVDVVAQHALGLFWIFPAWIAGPR